MNKLLFFVALKSPNGLPATPPEVQKIPTPGMGECVTPPAHPPMVKMTTPVMEPIRTPQLPPIRYDCLSKLRDHFRLHPKDEGR